MWPIKGTNIPRGTEYLHKTIMYGILVTTAPSVDNLSDMQNAAVNVFPYVYDVPPPGKNDRPFSDNFVIWDPMNLVGGSN